MVCRAGFARVVGEPSEIRALLEVSFKNRYFIGFGESLRLHAFPGMPLVEGRKVQREEALASALNFENLCFAFHSLSNLESEHGGIYKE
jgi:hypothetical protein